MVVHSISMECEENSSDIELSLDVAEEVDHVQNVPPSSIGLKSTKKNSENDSNKVVSGVNVETNDSSNDFSSTPQLTKETSADGDEFDTVELDLSSCELVKEQCNKTKEQDKLSRGTHCQINANVKGSHISNVSSSKTNGVPSRRTSENENSTPSSCFIDSNSSSSRDSPKSVLTNGFLPDAPSLPTKKLNSVTNCSSSSITQEFVSDKYTNNSCDKSVNQSFKEKRVNGDLPKLLNDDGSASAAAYKRRLDSGMDDYENRSVDDSSSFLEKRSKVEDGSFVPSNIRSTVSESSINSATTTSPEQNKKATARKSTTAAAASLKTLARIVEEESQKQRPAEIADFVRPIHSGDGDSSIDIDVSSQRNESSAPSSTAKEIKFTPNSFSDECLANIFKKMRQRLSRRQLEEIVLQKCCEMISESSEVGELKKVVAEYQQAEVYRKQTVYNLEKQLYQLKGVCNVFLEKARTLKENSKITMPTVVTRSVGLQVAFDANPFAKFDSSSPAIRSMSADEDDQKPSPFSVSSHRASLDGGPSSGSSSPMSLPRAAPSENPVTETGKKPPLPAVNDTATNSDNNASASSVSSSSAEQRVNNGPPPSEDIVDLTDLDDKNDSPPRPPLVNASRNSFPNSRPGMLSQLPIGPRHPAPLPPTPKNRTQPGWKLSPPKPDLTIQKNDSAIQMTWDLVLNAEYAQIMKYQIYAYQETSAPSSADLWKFVGDVDSLALPMACTLTQFVNGYTYHFAVRAVDQHARVGPFSYARSITL